jgi:hypothetical protein
MDGLDVALAAARRTALLREKFEARRALPAGCKGAACPAFALCQGRCATGPKPEAANTVISMQIESEAA